MIGSALTIRSPSSIEPQPQHAVRGRVLRADVEHHVLGGQVCSRPGAAALEAEGPAPAPTPMIRSSVTPAIVSCRPAG